MPSLLSSIVRGQIRLLSPLINSATLEQVREAQDGLSRLSARAVRGSVRYKPVPFDAFEAAWAIPLQGHVRQAIVYLHGGAYTAGRLPYAKAFGGLLAQKTGRATLCVGYRLAPEHPFPAALTDALDAYKAALERYAPSDIALIGESAGGGLCYALALKLKALGLPQPDRIVAISPWTDLSMSRDYSQLEALEPVLTCAGLRKNADMYRGEEDVRHPMISPLYGELDGLPPSLIIAGGHELLLDDSRLLHEKLLGSGCESQLHVEEGMWHVYPLYGVPEANEAMRLMTAFLGGGRGDG